MIHLDLGKKAVAKARQSIEAYVTNNYKTTNTGDLKGVSNEKLGVFVTLHTYPQHALRGCIGIPLPIMPFNKALVEAAQSSTQDPRFPPLTQEELEHIIIEVTIMTKPELLTIDKPKEYLSKIKIGRDGLIVEQGFYKGLLLPQVPVEQRWDVETYLGHTCMKAGLPPDAWLDKNTKIYSFTGQIFAEKKPNGEIQEKKLDGCNN